MDRGFVLSDHVDWPSLLDAIAATGATRIGVTHGYRDAVVRWLREHGLDAWTLASHWEGEADESDATAADDADADGAPMPEAEP